MRLRHPCGDFNYTSMNMVCSMFARRAMAAKAAVALTYTEHAQTAMHCGSKNVHKTELAGVTCSDCDFAPVLKLLNSGPVSSEISVFTP